MVRRPVFQHVAVCDAFLFVGGYGDEEGREGRKVREEVAELFDGIDAGVAAVIGKDELIGRHAVFAQ